MTDTPKPTGRIWDARLIVSAFAGNEKDATYPVSWDDLHATVQALAEAQREREEAREYEKRAIEETHRKAVVIKELREGAASARNAIGEAQEIADRMRADRDREKSRAETAEARAARLAEALLQLTRVANRVALTVRESDNVHHRELVHATGAGIAALTPAPSPQATVESEPAHGSDCPRLEDGAAPCGCGAMEPPEPPEPPSTVTMKVTRSVRPEVDIGGEPPIPSPFPIDAEAEARFEKLLAKKRGPSPREVALERALHIILNNPDPATVAGTARAALSTPAPAVVTVDVLREMLHDAIVQTEVDSAQLGRLLTDGERDRIISTIIDEEAGHG